ncbi:hypothetical protein TanjilG_27031 [Lupinus angustifolius]|uniref:Uncharacterized protein n=1 Tax=Lupinus angustifolius TaxID=3871 RepID=A0A4P1QVV5_LUPAN|nr:PREDICTED: N66 matrix protein-like [Lupinus angustifolius]OIV95927.1 hypothetical protein TanjilG_27031 [Lupinus angustifolius]
MALNIRSLRNLLGDLEGEEAPQRSTKYGTNHGTRDSFNNYGLGNQSLIGANINNGDNSGNHYNRYSYDNHGGNSINNSGTFNGNGNGGNVAGNFDGSTRNYY